MGLLGLKLGTYMGTGGGSPVEPPHYIVTSDSSLIDDTLTDFPVCTQLNSTDQPALFADLAALEGINAAKKITIKDSDQSTVLNTEVDYCSIADGIIVLHTALTLPPSADYVHYIYFDASGDDNAQMGAVGSAVGQSIWDANFVGVYHCNEDPTAVANILDSTSNGNNMISSGSMNTADLVANQPGRGYNMDGSNDSVYDTTALGINAYPFTMEGACLANVPGSGYGSPTVALADNSSSSVFFTLNMYDQGIRIITTGSDIANGPTNVVDGEFAHLAFVNTDATTHTGYINGASDVVSNYNYAFPTGLLDRASLNSVRDSSPSYRSGPIAEARFSNIARSAAWLKATYNTLNDSLSNIVYQP